MDDNELSSCWPVRAVRRKGGRMWCWPVQWIKPPQPTIGSERLAHLARKSACPGVPASANYIQSVNVALKQLAEISTAVPSQHCHTDSNRPPLAHWLVTVHAVLF